MKIHSKFLLQNRFRLNVFFKLNNINEKELCVYIIYRELVLCMKSVNAHFMHQHQIGKRQSRKSLQNAQEYYISDIKEDGKYKRGICMLPIQEMYIVSFSLSIRLNSCQLVWLHSLIHQLHFMPGCEGRQQLSWYKVLRFAVFYIHPSRKKESYSFGSLKYVKTT